MKERCPHCDEKMIHDKEDEEWYCPYCGHSEPVAPPTLQIKVADRIKTSERVGGQ